MTAMISALLLRIVMSLVRAMQLRLQDGYDHSYYFISTFAEEHVNFHADALQKEYSS